MNKYYLHSILALLYQLTFFSISAAQSERQITNSLAFAKLYGYVRYFHPSEEASKIDWNRFVVYGMKQSENCADETELINSLTALFKPIAPSIVLHLSKDQVSFDKEKLIPPNVKEYDPVCWQHIGVGLSFTDPYYKSERTNQTVSGQLFPEMPGFGEYVDAELGAGSNVKAIIPLVLYAKHGQTYPSADNVRLNILNQQLKNIPDSLLDARYLYTRLADLAVAWNVFQHFFPYFPNANTDWEKDLREAFQRVYNDKGPYEFLQTLQYFTAKLKDGHIRVLLSQNLATYLPAIGWEWIENRLVITEVLDPSLQLKVGDVVTKVNGQSPELFFDTVKKYISASTAGWLNSRAQLESLLGRKGSIMDIQVTAPGISEKTIRLTHTLSVPDYYSLRQKKATILSIRPGIVYINLDRAPMNEINDSMPVLQKASSIICDLRGYPRDNHQFIQYLLNSADTSSQWMRIPKIIYPDQDRIAGYKKSGWLLKPSNIHLNAKIIFIIDGSAISYAETYMSFIAHYKLATIVGQPTAGTNGDVNFLTLAGGYAISWTGMLVTKHDGSILHGVGILPDIYLEKTIQGVRDKKDEFLEKAVELSNRPHIKKDLENY